MSAYVLLGPVCTIHDRRFVEKAKALGLYVVRCPDGYPHEHMRWDNSRTYPKEEVHKLTQFIKTKGWGVERRWESGL